MDVLLESPFTAIAAYPRLLRARTFKPAKVSVQPPPLGFDFLESVLPGSREMIAWTHPELRDLAKDGMLLLVEKGQFGPVPALRTEFVEPQEIWLVGMSHISEDLDGDTERVVRALSLDNVVVELCRSRAVIMYTTTNGQPDEQMWSSGQAALGLRLHLAVFSLKISINIDSPFGNEFRATQKASEEVGFQIVLGDRPIEIPLQRAWRCLSWDQKIGLVSWVICGITSHREIYREEIQDQYLAWSLKRRKAVNNSKRVVGVIGKGHMNGVVYALVSDQGNLRFRDLAGKAPGDGGSRVWVENLMRSLVKDTNIGNLLWALHELAKGR